MIVTKSSTYQFAKNESGGKGFNLYRLSKMGLPVPTWVTLGKRYFHQFLKDNELSTQIANLLTDFAEGRLTADQVEAQVLLLIEGGKFSKALEMALSQALNLLANANSVSVRSSAADEDGQLHSFAGQLSSYLYVQGREQIAQSIKKCWASGFTARGLSYRKENGISLSGIAVSVVIQEMIDPEKSGVLFTCDPVKKSNDHYVVSSVYGVGEGLVSGALDADTFWLDANNGQCTTKEIVEKSEQFKKDKVSVPQELWNQPSLSDHELRQLYGLGKKIVHELRRPQDIEWAIAGGKVYLLQTRPVTNLETNLVGFPNLWDNSNIVESYGGLTSPLSFSFALRNYRGVYVQFCEILGVPNEVVKDMDSYLSYMLGSINGRVFYNLFNWYKLVGVLPGFQQNREFMETMMGVSETLTDEIANRIHPHPSWETPMGKFRKVVTGFNFLRYHFTIQNMVNQFLSDFQKVYDRFRNMNLRQMRGDELMPLYFQLEREMMGRWKAPIINDFLCMVHFGLLRKLTLTWLKDLDSTIQNDLMSGEGGLESAEPTKAMMRLAYQVSKSPTLLEIFNKTEASDLMEALNQSQEKEFYRDILDYIDRFGFRCMSEMKLEEIDLSTDTTYLFVCIKNYLRSGEIKLHDPADEIRMRRTAEAKVNKHLSGIKRIVFGWVLKHARKAVKNRENTRFARTRAYGVARIIFQSVGEDMAGQGVLEHPRDIFWLTIEEVFGIYNATLPSYDVTKLVQLRKDSYAKFEEEPQARIFTRGEVYWHNSFWPKHDETTEATDEYDLKGLPCCPGILEGTVKVVMNPGDDLNLNGEILVTARTDPGWVPLYPSISGLLVERGSLLSHSAIVAREMGIPAIVSIPGLTKRLKTGMKIRMDGKAGTIKILS